MYQQGKDEQIKQLIQRMPIIVVEASMRIGVVRGQHRHMLNDFFKPDFEDIRFHYGHAYGCLDVAFDYVNFRDRYTAFQYRLLHRGDVLPIDVVANAFNQITQLLMPGIKQENNLCGCENPYHIKDEWSREIYTCQMVGDKWVCPKCVEQFSLADYNPILDEKLPKREQSERAKMTPALRFSILQRDNFACRSCGRNAHEDGVKLHVDHIVAIKNGGKTEPDNLHTLCQDCNLGKSDKRVEQMELWK